MGDRMVVAAKDDIEVSGRGGVAWIQRALLAERDRWLLWATVYNVSGFQPSPDLLKILTFISSCRRVSLALRCNVVANWLPIDHQNR